MDINKSEIKENPESIKTAAECESAEAEKGGGDAEYITEKEAYTLKELFKRNLQSYKEKEPSVSDQEWLAKMFHREIPDITEEEAQMDSEEIVEAIHTFDENLTSVNKASEQGVSKESWLADRIQDASVGMAVQEYGARLQALDDVLYTKNMELRDALTVTADGHVRVNQNPNLDGLLAEQMVAKTTELSGFARGQNIRVDVLNSHAANSVDVRAWNLDTGRYQNYQLKFGKDAKATIALIEGGDYANQRIIVPSEQLSEVQEYFKSKGSQKTITDHIEIAGAKGKSFTKSDLKQLQETAQEEGVLPELDYSHYQTRDLAMSIGKNAGVMALQAAAVSTGLNVAAKLMRGESVDSDELVEIAITTGADTSLKTVTAGTLQVAIRKGIIRFIPKATPAGVIANIACVGIENVKILMKIASGEISPTKGLDQMGRVTVSMTCGLWGMVKGAALGASLAALIPVVGIPIAVVTGFVGGMVGYFCGSKVGEKIYSAGKKVASVAKNVGKAAVNTLKKVGSKVASGVKSLGRLVFG
ncbi:MAG: hypothetical protein LUF35_08450 [Lachnospiraceae bacterium]|nr:hypothetical protein [Lachnospiraceae bacterium]